MVDYSIIGERIKRYRKKMNMTQAQLAENLNVSTSYMSQIERGKACCSLFKLDDIATILNIDYIDLLCDTDRKMKTFCDKDIAQLTVNWPPEMKALLIELLKTSNAFMKIRER